MNFVNPEILYLLFILPLLGILFIWARVYRKIKLKRFGTVDNIKKLSPQASLALPMFKIIIELLAIAALIIALARPVGEDFEQTQEANGIEVVVALDISKSMDASSTNNSKSVSRLSRAKLIVDKMIDKLGQNRVGLVLFAGSAYTQLPITNDYVSARIFLDDISTSSAQTQGTDIAGAIQRSMSTFSDVKDVNKAIILITDSEDHEGSTPGNPSPLDIAKKAAAANVEIDVIGIGMEQAPIPLNNSKNEFLKDREGKTVMTALNVDLARQIASAGKGVYIDGNSNDAVDQLIQQLDKIEKKDLGVIRYKSSAEKFPIFIWIAFGLLILDIFILDRKYKWVEKLNIFNEAKK